MDNDQYKGILGLTAGFDEEDFDSAIILYSIVPVLIIYNFVAWYHYQYQLEFSKT